MPVDSIGSRCLNRYVFVAVNDRIEPSLQVAAGPRMPVVIGARGPRKTRGVRSDGPSGCADGRRAL